MLSQYQIEQFFSGGFLVVDLHVKPRLLEAIVQETLAAYPAKANGRYHHGTRLQDFWKASFSVKKLALLPEILGMLEALYQRRPLPFQTLNFPVGTQQPMHADTLHFNSYPSNFLCGVWVALEDVDEGNGPVSYCRGSHLLPEITMQDVGKGITYDNYKHYEAYIREMIKEKGYQPELVTMKKGQALIWHGNLLHGGSPQRDKDRSRHSQVTHYFFDGCRYYTPMLSTPEEIHWREPEWIEFETVQAAKSKVEDLWSRLTG